MNLPAVQAAKGEVGSEPTVDQGQSASPAAIYRAQGATSPFTAYLETHLPVFNSVQMRVYSLSTSGGMMAKVKSLASTSGGG